MTIPFPVNHIVTAPELNELSRGHWRKVTAKTVNNTAAETDLLNGEITIDAGAMGTTRMLRLVAYGDALYNSGVTVAAPRFKLKLGGTTLLDTNTIAACVANSATRYPWRIEALIHNLTAATQSAFIQGTVTWSNTGSVTEAAFATGTGRYLFRNVGAINECLGWNSGAVDTTAACALVLSVTLASAHASHEIILKNALAEVV